MYWRYHRWTLLKVATITLLVMLFAGLILLVVGSIFLHEMRKLKDYKEARCCFSGTVLAQGCSSCAHGDCNGFERYYSVSVWDAPPECSSDSVPVTIDGFSPNADLPIGTTPPPLGSMPVVTLGRSWVHELCEVKRTAIGCGVRCWVQQGTCAAAVLTDPQDGITTGAVMVAVGGFSFCIYVCFCVCFVAWRKRTQTMRKTAKRVLYHAPLRWTMGVVKRTRKAKMVTTEGEVVEVVLEDRVLQHEETGEHQEVSVLVSVKEQRPHAEADDGSAGETFVPADQTYHNFDHTHMVDMEGAADPGAATAPDAAPPVSLIVLSPNSGLSTNAPLGATFASRLHNSPPRGLTRPLPEENETTLSKTVPPQTSAPASPDRLNATSNV